MVQKRVIRHVDKELAGGAVFLCGARHRDGAARVWQAVIRFVFHRHVGRLLLHIRSKAAALHHKARDHAMENRVVIKTAVDVINEVFHGRRRFLAVQLQLNISRRGRQQNVRVAFCRQRSRRQGRESKYSRQSGFEHEEFLTKQK